ncbi:hypothetical protein BS47DRAFT_1397969 [Hydnum rufescens UP504]|uniref:Uncharacterized protein n=1 Tax=Hydnum rufescens UP504 TaxID=1448309 RepID=A0A9P6ALR6_9AGAM|nr:hypothetical protein BS47DRAFT_1397969 [Hydnum rufescens UP504]
MSDPSSPHNSIPPFLLPGNLAKRPLGVWYTQLVNLMHDESPPYTAFKLATIFNWELVYLRINRMSFENDPWHASKGSSDSLVPKSFGGSPQAAKDQQGAERKGRAADWCQPLDGDTIKKYFIASKPGSSGKNSLLQSLSVTHFRVLDSRPNVVDVILAAYAVSTQRWKYHLWTANCWWLARSIRLFIQMQWGGEDDGEMPEGLLVDMRERDLVADQPKILVIYGKFNTIRERNLNLHTAELCAQAAEEAQQAAEEAQWEVEEAQWAAEETQRAAEEAQWEAEELAAHEAEQQRLKEKRWRLEEERRRAAEADVLRKAEGCCIEAEGRHAAEAQIAKLQEQLRLLTPDSAYT